MDSAVVGRSARMRAVFEFLRVIGDSESTVVIHGRAARGIHTGSQSLEVKLALRLVAKNDLHIVDPAIVEQRDRGGIDRRPV